MARLVKNPKQTAESQAYADNNGQVIVFHKEGYYFSDDSSMDSTVDYFINELGFELVKKKEEKKEEKKVVLKK